MIEGMLMWPPSMFHSAFRIILELQPVQGKLDRTRVDSFPRPRVSFRECVILKRKFFPRNLAISCSVGLTEAYFLVKRRSKIAGNEWSRGWNVGGATTASTTSDFLAEAVGCLLVLGCWFISRLFALDWDTACPSKLGKMLRNWLVQIVFRRERNNQTATKTYPIDPCSHNFTSIPIGKKHLQYRLLWVDFWLRSQKIHFTPSNHPCSSIVFCRRIGAECLKVGSSVDSTWIPNNQG